VATPCNNLATGWQQGGNRLQIFSKCLCNPALLLSGSTCNEYYSYKVSDPHEVWNLLKIHICEVGKICGRKQVATTWQHGGNKVATWWQQPGNTVFPAFLQNYK